MVYVEATIIFGFLKLKKAMLRQRQDEEISDSFTSAPSSKHARGNPDYFMITQNEYNGHRI